VIVSLSRLGHVHARGRGLRARTGRPDDPHRDLRLLARFRTRTALTWSTRTGSRSGRLAGRPARPQGLPQPAPHLPRQGTDPRRHHCLSLRPGRRVPRLRWPRDARSHRARRPPTAIFLALPRRRARGLAGDDSEARL